jgi:outer membrane protein assembly factor BamB
MQVKSLIYGLLLVLLTISVLPAVAGDWAKWRGPNGNGVVDDSEWNPNALSGSPKIVWKTQLGLGYSAVAVQGNRLYTMGNFTNGANGKDIVYCLNAASGKEIWRYTYTCKTSERWPGPTATPVLDGNRLYTLSDDTGDLHCLNAENGKVLWKRNVVSEFDTVPPYDGVGYSGSALIEGDLILLNLNTAGVALDKSTGRTVWASAPGRCSFSTPVVFNRGSQRKMALFGAEKFFIVNIQTGKVEGFYDWKTNCNENTSDPIVVDDKVFISSAYGMGCALLQMTEGNPKLVWKNREMSNQFTSSVYLDGYVYGFDGERPRCSLKCIALETGKVMWKEKMPFGSLIAVDRKLLVLDEDGVIHVAQASPAAYKEIARGQVQFDQVSGKNRKFWWTNPVLANGYLYVRSDKGDLMCLDARRK